MGVGLIENDEELELLLEELLRQLEDDELELLELEDEDVLIKLIAHKSVYRIVTDAHPNIPPFMTS